jgi:hypothetical protein
VGNCFLELLRDFAEKRGKKGMISRVRVRQSAHKRILKTNHDS